MACGTPVIAFDRGSMSELIDERTTGMLVADVDEAAAAIKVIGALPRGKIRVVAVERFSRDYMVEKYEAVYVQLLANAGRELPPPSLVSTRTHYEIPRPNGSVHV